MKNVTEFFDQLQSRFSDIYTEKFRLDNSIKNGKPRNGGEMDGKSLYFELIEAHDYVRSMRFSSILEYAFIDEAHNRGPVTEALKPVFNQFTRLLYPAEFDLAKYLSNHLTYNAADPVRIANKDGQLFILAHSQVRDENELVKIQKDVEAKFKTHPYLMFLYSVSLCETVLPKLED